MRWIIAGSIVFLASMVTAQEAAWMDMDGPQITQTLTGKTVEYANARQDFRASGRTLYTAGQDSWGYWAVRGDTYCSLWPPQDLWACYRMQQRAGEVRFIGTGNDITTGVFVD